MAESAEQQDALFVNLLLMFQAAGMQQMGKVTNPVTGEVEKNLDQARFSIDMIEMLKAKTSGNLSTDLEKLLDSTLTNLRLNYVDELDKTAQGQAEPGSDEKAEGRPQARETGDTGSEVSPGADSEPSTGPGKEPGAKQ